MPLSLGADAGGDAHLAAGFDLDTGPLVGPDPGALDVGHESESEVPALGAGRRLGLGEELVVADELPRLGERRFVVAAVVDQRREVLVDDFVVVGKVLGREEIPAPDLGSIHPQLGGGEVEQPLHDEDAMLATGAAIRSDDRLGREDRLELRVVGRDPVAAQQRALAVDRHREAIGHIGPGIVKKHILDAEDRAVTGQGDLGIVRLAALLGGGDEVLLAILDPLDRALELDRHPGDDDLLLVEHHDLRPEAAADEGRDDPDLVLGQPEHGGETVADRDRRLGGVPDRQPLGARVPVGDDTPVLHRRRRPVVVEQSTADHHVGGLARLLVVTLLLDDVRRDVGAEVLVDPRRGLAQGFLEIDDRRQHLVVDPDLGHRVFREVAALGDHHRHRLADVAHLVAGQWHLGPLVELTALDRRRRDEKRPGAPIVP